MLHFKAIGSRIQNKKTTIVKKKIRSDIGRGFDNIDFDSFYERVPG